MAQTVTTKVPFTPTNVGKCMCPKCPVQSKSACITGKLSMINEALKKTPLSAEDITGVYCSSGKATCKDINTKESCICGTCSVYGMYRLAAGKPGGYFCKSGANR